MTTEIFTVYDKIAMQCKGVFHAINKADAVREFRKQFKENPDREDFELLKLGNFNHDKGIIDALEIPENVSVNFGGPKKDA